MKIAHIRLRVDVFEEFAIDYNLTAQISIRYGQKFIAQWEINPKRKHTRAKDHFHDTHSLIFIHLKIHFTNLVNDKTIGELSYLKI